MTLETVGRWLIVALISLVAFTFVLVLTAAVIVAVGRIRVQDKRRGDGR